MRRRGIRRWCWPGPGSITHSSHKRWTGEQLVPLIAALDEVLPWVEQWHPEVAPGLGQPLAAFYRGQVDQVLASIGATAETVAAWEPPASTRGRKKNSDSAHTAAPTSEN